MKREELEEIFTKVFKQFIDIKICFRGCFKKSYVLFYCKTSNFLYLFIINYLFNFAVLIYLLIKIIKYNVY